MMKEVVKASLKVTIQTAIELKEALEELKDEFTLEHGVHIELIEGDFSAQIKDDFEKCLGYYELGRSSCKNDREAITKAVQRVKEEIQKDLLELYDITLYEEKEEGFYYEIF